jgi:hypothetical protein
MHNAMMQLASAIDSGRILIYSDPSALAISLPFKEGLSYLDGRVIGSVQEALPRIVNPAWKNFEAIY